MTSDSSVNGRLTAGGRAGDGRPGHVDLEIVVPALNEEARIGPTLRALVAQLAILPVTSRILVVDNGSVDRTADVVDDCADDARRSGVSVTLMGCKRPGKGSAVTKGILASHSTWVGFCDADLATPATTLVGAVSLLAAGAEVVIGSRRCDGASYAERQPLVRRVGGAGFRWLTRDLAGAITDTQCGFKFFTGAVARRLFAACQIGGFAFDLEIIARTHLHGFAIVELPVNWQDQAGSTLRPLKDGKRIWRELRTLRSALENSPDPTVAAAISELAA